MKCSVKSFAICNLPWRPLLLCTPVHLYYHFFGLKVKKSLEKSRKVSKSLEKSRKVSKSLKKSDKLKAAGAKVLKSLKS